MATKKETEGTDAKAMSGQILSGIINTAEPVHPMKAAPPLTPLGNAAKLASKMSSVMKAIRSIDKDGENTHFKYSFVQDMDVLHECRTAMCAAGIGFAVSMLDLQRDGKKTIVKCSYTFTDTETGFSDTQTWFGEADDAQDKGCNKAVTACTKYFLLKTFLIPTGLEDDPDGQAPVPDIPRPRPSISPEELERNAKLIMSREFKMDRDQFAKFKSEYKDWVKLAIAAEGDGVKSYDGLVEYAAGLEALEMAEA